MKQNQGEIKKRSFPNHKINVVKLIFNESSFIVPMLVVKMRVNGILKSTLHSSQARDEK
jgi:hypothetical protein